MGNAATAKKGDAVENGRKSFFVLGRETTYQLAELINIQKWFLT